MKKIIELLIRHSVLSSALGILIVLLGMIGLWSMSIRFLPPLTQAVITIHTLYPGAESSLVKTFITNNIQTALVGTSGVDYMTSSSTMSNSDITLYLNSGVDADALLPSIMSKISSMQSDLPTGSKPPLVGKKNIDHQPMLLLSFSSQALSRVAVADYLQRNVSPILESIDGVEQAEVLGDRYAMEIFINPYLMNAYHVTAQDIVHALNAQNLLTAAGHTEGTWFNIPLNVASNLHTEAEFNQLVVKMIHGVPIRLMDVGLAKMAPEDNQFMVYYDHKKATFMAIHTLPDANPLRVVHDIFARLPEITQSLPRAIHMDIVLDRTAYIHEALIEVLKTLIFSMIIVFVVMVLFLDSFQAALIPMTMIPISLIGVCFLMRCFSCSMNTITLLAMVLATSLVVDDAIVLVENNMRLLLHESSAFKASAQAVNELITPIIAMTLTLLAVYIPIGFSSGLIGALFTEFAVVLSGSVVLSGLLALTVAPMMSARLLAVPNKKNRINAFLDDGMQKYRCLLRYLFCAKRTMMVLWLLMLIAVGILYVMLPKELSPRADMGFVIAMSDKPAQANRNYLMHYADQAHTIFDQTHDIDDYATILSQETNYLSYLIVRAEHLKQTSIFSWMPTLTRKLSTIAGLDIHLVVPNAFISSGPTVQFVLQANSDARTLSLYAKQIEHAALQSDYFNYLTDDARSITPQAQINIDRQALINHNVLMQDAADALSIVMGASSLQQFSLHGQSYHVLIKLFARDQLRPEQLLELPIATQNQTIVPLSSVAHLDYSVTPTTFNQFQKMNSVTISGEMKADHTLSEGITVLNQVARSIVPKTVHIDYAGATRQYHQETYRMLWIFLAAALIIFLVLSMQFNSYRQAWIILLGSVPCALFAALVPLCFTSSAINIYTNIGLLTLVGLIAKHGVLMTRFADQLKMTNRYDAQTAVIEAALLRLRPILMTTAAMVCGALPLIFSSGPGSESRHAIGLVIVYGMSIGTMLTLFVLPVVYTFFSEKGDRNLHSADLY